MAWDSVHGDRSWEPGADSLAVKVLEASSTKGRLFHLRRPPSSSVSSATSPGQLPAASTSAPAALSAHLLLACQETRPKPQASAPPSPHPQTSCPSVSTPLDTHRTEKDLLQTRLWLKTMLLLVSIHMPRVCPIKHQPAFTHLFRGGSTFNCPQDLFLSNYTLPAGPKCLVFSWSGLLTHPCYEP